MKARTIFVSLIAMLIWAGCTDKKVQSEKAILQDLQRLDSYTSTGLNYPEYSNRMLDVFANVDVALKGLDDLAFASRIAEINGNYVAAREAWKNDVGPQQYWTTATTNLRRLEKYVDANASVRQTMDEQDRRRREEEWTAIKHQREVEEQQFAQNKARAEAAEKAKLEHDAETARVAEARRLADESAERQRQKVAAETEYHRRFAPEGTLFLLQVVNARLKGGLAGMPPGTEVSVVRRNSNGSLHVKEKAGNLEADIDPSLGTNDRDLAANLQRADQDEQQGAADQLSQVQSDEARRQFENNIRAGRHMDNAGAQYGTTGRNLGSNALDGHSY